MRDPWEVATWRFEQISPLLAPSLSRAEKRRYFREKSAQPVAWPGADAERSLRRPIGRATLWRWLRLYQSGGLTALLPKPPARQKPDRSRLVAYALALLVEEPERSLTQLLTYLALEFPEAKVARSTLQRELALHPAYADIIKLRRGATRKLRRRYETAYPHQCWQLDGKGPFQVTIAGVVSRRVCVLSVIDDHSRYILATVVSPRGENTAAAVRVLRLALATYGLPERMQFDRGSAFDSLDFRRGLALLGIHRNWVKPRDPEAQGKIEAFHRVLTRWFIRELRHQEILGGDHLEELLRATLDLLYHRHRHRELKMTPAQALQGRVSPRRVSAEDLHRAFWGSVKASSHAKTGEVRLPNGTFRVPGRYAGHRAAFRRTRSPRTGSANSSSRSTTASRRPPRPTLAPRLREESTGVWVVNEESSESTGVSSGRRGGWGTTTSRPHRPDDLQSIPASTAPALPCLPPQPIPWMDARPRTG